jgi:hypothetical protein
MAASTATANIQSLLFLSTLLHKRQGDAGDVSERTSPAGVAADRVDGRSAQSTAKAATIHGTLELTHAWPVILPLLIASTSTYAL